MLGVAQKKVPKVLFIRNVFIDDCINIDQNIDSKLLNINNSVELKMDVPNIGSNQYSAGMSSFNYDQLAPQEQSEYNSNLIEQHNSYESIMNKSTDSLMGLTAYSFNKDYNKIPKIFESLETWPKSTNLHCWYCSNQFTTIPLFVPQVIEPNIHTKNDDKYLIEVGGNVCKWPCGMSHIRETTKDIVKAIERKNNFYFLHKILNGTYPVHIPEAPSKYLLKKYGGNMTPEQYYKLYNSEEYDVIQ